MDEDTEHDDTEHDQADLIPLLLQHLHAPLTGTSYLRGVLPAPGGADAVRVAVGAVNAVCTRELTLYQFPLVVGEDSVTAYDVIGMLRSLCGGAGGGAGGSRPSGRGRTVMGMPLVAVDPAAVARAPETDADRGLRLLRTLVRPYDETWGDPLLHGFLFLDPGPGAALFPCRGDARRDRRRRPDDRGAHRADRGAPLAARRGGEQMAADDGDPHCARVLDVTYW